MELKHRLIEGAQIRKVSEDDRTIEFVASDNSVDSYGTVLPVDKWDLTRYAKNGVIGYQHEVYGSDVFKGSDPDDVIGKGVAFVENDQLIVRVTFEPAELNQKADKIYRKVLFGSLNGVSVGFAPVGEGHWGSKRAGEDPDVFYYGGQELLEVSVVNIPSNANALRRSIDEEKAALPERKAEEEVVEAPEVAPQVEPEAEPVAEPVEEDNSQYLLTIARAKATLA